MHGKAACICQVEAGGTLTGLQALVALVHLQVLLALAGHERSGDAVSEALRVALAVLLDGVHDARQAALGSGCI